jgi:hypothetical protein
LIGGPLQQIGSENVEMQSTPKPKQTPSKRILACVEVFENKLANYNSSVYRGNTPLKEPRGNTPLKESNRTPARPDIPWPPIAPELEANMPADNPDDSGIAQQDFVSLASVDLDQAVDAAGIDVQFDPEPAPEAEEELEPYDDAESRISPLPSEVHEPEVAQDFPVYAAQEAKRPKQAPKAVAKSAVPSRLKIGAPAAAKNEPTRILAPEVKKAMAKPKAVVRKPSPGPAKAAKDKENRPVRVASPGPRDTPRKGPSMAVASPRRSLQKSPAVVKKQEPPQFVLTPIDALLMEENYDITDKENSDDDEDLDRSKKFVPTWARGWASRVKAQADMDPDAVFGPIPQCSLDRIFRDPASAAARKNRAWRPRGSSNDWRGDKLRQEEIDSYRSRMGHTRKP